MNKMKSISLFCVLVLIVFGSGYLCGRCFEISLYENREYNDDENSVDYESDKLSFARTVSFDEGRIKEETAFYTREYDADNNRYITRPGVLPKHYIGMSREEFIEELSFENKSEITTNTGENIKKELVFFSPEKIIVQNDGYVTGDSEGYYLGVKDREVVVYMKDQCTEYFSTGIPLENFPPKLQQRINQFYYIENYEKLFDLLENYSS